MQIAWVLKMKKIDLFESETDQVHREKTKIMVGVSACLVGLPVRYNGGHSQSKLLLNKLQPYFEFKSFCPEVAAGFAVPRPTMRLVGDPILRV